MLSYLPEDSLRDECEIWISIASTIAAEASYKFVRIVVTVVGSSND